MEWIIEHILEWIEQQRSARDRVLMRMRRMTESRALCWGTAAVALGMISLLLYSAIRSLSNLKPLINIEADNLELWIVNAALSGPGYFFYIRAKTLNEQSRCGFCAAPLDPDTCYDDGSEMSRCIRCAKREVLAMRVLFYVVVALSCWWSVYWFGVCTSRGAIGTPFSTFDAAVLLGFTLPLLVPIIFLRATVRANERHIKAIERKIRDAKSHVTVRSRRADEVADLNQP